MSVKNLKSRNFSNWIVFVIGYSMLSTGIVSLITSFLSSIDFEYQKHMAYLKDLSIVVIVIAVLIVVPILEELIFRKLIMWIINMFTKKFFLINIIQALLFAIAHLNPMQIIYTFIFGLILGKSKKEFGTILAPIILHSVYNFLGIFPTLGIREIYKMNNIPIDVEASSSILDIVVILLLILLGSLIMYKINKKIKLVTKDIFTTTVGEVME